ncbi:MAG: hypothetical protein LBC43_00665 [Bifidobacteriaceae bacterium]|nr:hypothetical protein [Bifidobacteriaceae bacterium]
MDITWIDLIWPTFVTFLVVYLPGVLVGIAGRLPWSTSLAFAPIFSILIYCVPPLFLEPLGVWWTAWVPVISTVAVLIMVAATLWIVQRKSAFKIPSLKQVFSQSEIFSRTNWLLLAGAGLALSVFIVVMLWSVSAPWMVTNNYDTAFHLNATEHIIHVGRASSFTLRGQIMGAGLNFYPAAWHTLAAIVATLTGIEMMPAFYALMFIVCAVVWPLSLVYLTRKVFGPNTMRELIVFALSMMFCGIPYLMIDWGSLYPTLLSYCIAPLVLGAGYSAIRTLAYGNIRTKNKEQRIKNDEETEIRRQPTEDSLQYQGVSTSGSAAEDHSDLSSDICHLTSANKLLQPLILFVLSSVALFFAQPRTIFMVLVALLPYLIVQFPQIYSSLIKSRGPKFVKGFWITVAGLAVILVGMLLLFIKLIYGLSRPIEDRLNGPQAVPTNTWYESLFYMISITVRRSSGPLQSVDWLVLALLLLGIVALIVSKKQRWIIFGFLAVGALFVMASSFSDNFSKIMTALWYKDQRRIQVFTIVMAIPIIAYGLNYLIESISKSASEQLKLLRRPMILRTIAGTMLLGLVANSLLTPAAWDMRFRLWGTTEAWNFDSGENPKPLLLSLDDYKVIYELPKYMEPFGERYIGNPWDGSAFAQGLVSRSAYLAALDGNWKIKTLWLTQNWEVLAQYDQPSHSIEYYDSIWGDKELEAIYPDYDKYRACRYLVRDGKVKYLLHLGNSIEPQNIKSARFQNIQPLDKGFEELYRSRSSALYRITACDNWVSS